MFAVDNLFIVHQVPMVTQRDHKGRTFSKGMFIGLTQSSIYIGFGGLLDSDELFPRK